MNFDEWWAKKRSHYKADMKLLGILSITIIGRDIFDQKIKPLENAMNEFCDRVENGEIRSKKTYATFCKLLGRGNIHNEDKI